MHDTTAMSEWKILLNTDSRTNHSIHLVNKSEVNMGRKKIQITRINDERNRQVTFTKRKFGLMKKAYELSVLCDCEIALIIFTSNNKLYQYASSDMDKVLLKYTEYNDTVVSQTNKDIIELLSKREHKGDYDGDDDEFATLTPRTEENYKRIDAEYAKVMQQATAGRPVVTYASGAMPVTLPVHSSQSFAQTIPGTVVTQAASGSNTVVLLQPGVHGILPQTITGTKSSSTVSVTRTSPAPVPVSIQTQPSTSPVPHILVANKEAELNVTGGKPRPNLKVVIPSKSERNPQVCRSISSVLETPVLSQATPGNAPATLASAILPSDLTLNTADLAGLIGVGNSPLLWSSQPGPLTAAVQASGLALTPGGSLTLTPTSSGLLPVLAINTQKSSNIKLEPSSPRQRDQESPGRQAIQPPAAHQLRISPHHHPQIDEGEEPPEKQPRMMSDT
ncbi:hypothetical protein ScPMuIL_018961 [Solemya velum]